MWINATISNSINRNDISVSTEGNAKAIAIPAKTGAGGSSL
jgi:hypothetical protein